MQPPIDRAGCERLDAADELAPLRSRFSLPDGVVYLDGNSLGALPVAVADRVTRTVRQEWGGQLIRAWNEADWVSLPRRVGDRIGRLVGASPGTVVACESTSVNLYKVAMAGARLRPQGRVILTDSGNFPTDVYVLSGVAAQVGMTLQVVEPEEVADAISEDTAVVALTQVDYRTGRLHDMRGITATAHGAGALAVWDLAHSAGAMEVDLEGCDVDMAVGCGYKYLNGGPGAPAFVYVSSRLQDQVRNPIQGWFGHAHPFDFDLRFAPASGIDRMRVGTPHVLSMVALDEALSVFDDVDMSSLRAKSLSLTGLFIDLVESKLPGVFGIATPLEPDRRGSQVSLRHPDAYPIMQALIERGVIGDFREPDIARFGFAPLYVRHVDVWDSVDRLVEVMETRAWTDARYAVRKAVT
jgi:kynureninase